MVYTLFKVSLNKHYLIIITNTPSLVNFQLTFHYRHSFPPISLHHSKPKNSSVCNNTIHKLAETQEKLCHWHSEQRWRAKGEKGHRFCNPLHPRCCNFSWLRDHFSLLPTTTSSTVPFSLHSADPPWIITKEGLRASLTSRDHHTERDNVMLVVYSPLILDHHCWKDDVISYIRYLGTRRMPKGTVLVYFWVNWIISGFTIVVSFQVRENEVVIALQVGWGGGNFCFISDRMR